VSDLVKGTLAAIGVIVFFGTLFAWAFTLPADEAPVQVRECAHIACLGERLEP
jgi:hypothetical protein